MIKISVLCSRAGCPSRENVLTMDKKKLKKYLADRGWTIDGDNHFCHPGCYAEFCADKKFAQKRKTLTSKGDWAKFFYWLFAAGLTTAVLWM